MGPHRPPEAIIGAPCGSKMDLWSLGCSLYELHTERVLFRARSAPRTLARMCSVLGSFPETFLGSGSNAAAYFTGESVCYERQASAGDEDDAGYVLLMPKPTTLGARLHMPANDDAAFPHFLGTMLVVDPAQRTTASAALAHEWLADADSGDFAFDHSQYSDDPRCKVM